MIIVINIIIIPGHNEVSQMLLQDCSNQMKTCNDVARERDIPIPNKDGSITLKNNIWQNIALLKKASQVLLISDIDTKGICNCNTSPIPFRSLRSDTGRLALARFFLQGSNGFLRRC
jgi:hypothetical protein